MKKPFAAKRIGSVIVSPCWDRAAPRNEETVAFNAVSIQIPEGMLNFNNEPVSVIRSLTPKQALRLSEYLRKAAVALGQADPRVQCKRAKPRRKRKKTRT